MTQQEIDGLRAKLGDEYELITQSPDENDKFFVVIAKKKDPWEGVEFAECVITDALGRYTPGQIYPGSIDGDYFYTMYDNQGNKNGRNKYHFKPSTEAAYVSQLKEKVKEVPCKISTGWKDGHLLKQNKTMKRKIQQAERFYEINDLNIFLEKEGSNIISVTPLGGVIHVIFIVLYWKSIEL